MIPVSSIRQTKSEVSPRILPDQEFDPIIAVTIPPTSRGRKVAAIEAGTYWSSRMQELLIGSKIEGNHQPLKRFLVPLSQVQFPDPKLAYERLLRAHFQPSSFSDWCALTASMFNGEQDMRVVACLGASFIWGGKEMFPQTSEQSNGERHLRLFPWGNTTVLRPGYEVLVLCDQNKES